MTLKLTVQAALPEFWDDEAEAVLGGAAAVDAGATTVARVVAAALTAVEDGAAATLAAEDGAATGAAEDGAATGAAEEAELLDPELDPLLVPEDADPPEPVWLPVTAFQFTFEQSPLILVPWTVMTVLPPRLTV